MLRRSIGQIGVRVPGNLVIFIAAIFLSNSVNVFTTIYAQPGRPVSAPGLWWSCISSLVAAGLWTALAAKKDSIDKAVQSASAEPSQREVIRVQMWEDVWLRTGGYLLGAVGLSILAMVALVIP
jgi:hypothetical protein